MAAFGAELEIMDGPEGIHPGLIPAMQAHAAEIVARDGGYTTDQFRRSRCARRLPGHRHRGGRGRSTARSTAVCVYVGVGGCLVGTSEGIATRWPDTRPRRGRAGRVGGALGQFARHAPDRRRWRRVRSTAPPARRERSRALTTRSSPWSRRTHSTSHIGRGEENLGRSVRRQANLVAAIRLAERLGEGRRVLTVQCDSGMKYLHGDLYA